MPMIIIEEDTKSSVENHSDSATFGDAVIGLIESHDGIDLEAEDSIYDPQ